MLVFILIEMKQLRWEAIEVFSAKKQHRLTQVSVSGTDSDSGISWNFLFFWFQQLLSGVSFYFIDLACHLILQPYFTDT